MQAEDLGEYLNRIPELPANKQEELLVLFDELQQARSHEKTEIARDDFLEFTKIVWPEFIGGRHHKIMAEAFERVVKGECKRLIINMPPRHTKSEFASFLLPAWFLGKYPNKKVIQSANTADLAVGFGRRVRNLVSDDENYAAIFPGMKLAKDSQSAGHWHVNRAGEYFAIGVHGKVAGRGADLFIIDDPHSEQEAMLAERNPEIYDNVYRWYMSGPRQRLQPDASIIIVMTRWSKRDLTGRNIKSMIEREGDGDEWEIIELPALINENEEDEKPIWPEFWSYKELVATRNELPIPKWQAQYQQKPTSEEGAIIKREWWQDWTEKEVPPCDFVIQSWDTAFLKTERANYSACTTWGIFTREDKKTGKRTPNILLLDAYKARLEFPDLKRIAYQLYKEWEPDAFIIEARASGAPLIFELRAMGIPVQEFTPARGKRGMPNDKIARANSITDIFASGFVWAPPTRWAEEVIEECASFPSGEQDDYVDSTTQAMMRFRQGGFIQLYDDWEDEEEDFLLHRRQGAYY